MSHILTIARALLCINTSDKVFRRVVIGIEIFQDKDNFAFLPPFQPVWIAESCTSDALHGTLRRLRLRPRPLYGVHDAPVPFVAVPSEYWRWRQIVQQGGRGGTLAPRVPLGTAVW